MNGVVFAVLRVDRYMGGVWCAGSWEVGLNCILLF